MHPIRKVLGLSKEQDEKVTHKHLQVIRDEMREEIKEIKDMLNEQAKSMRERAEQGTGMAKDFAEKEATMAKEMAEREVKMAQEFVQTRPLLSLCVAMGVGFFLGVVLARSKD